MAHARQADRAMPQVAIFIGAALLAVAVITSALLINGGFGI